MCKRKKYEKFARVVYPFESTALLKVRYKKATLNAIAQTSAVKALYHATLASVFLTSLQTLFWETPFDILTSYA